VGRPERPSAYLSYTRHFILLTCFSVLLAVTTGLQASSGPAVSFAAYGALHASALLLALRARRAPWRLALFIAVAAVLSAMTVCLGITGMHVFGGAARFYVVLGSCAITGAAAYGCLIRLMGLYELSAWQIVVISIGCMLAAFVGMVTIMHSRYLGRWWLAVLWWYAFSGGLWYFDRRRIAANLHRQISPRSA